MMISRSMADVVNHSKGDPSWISIHSNKPSFAMKQSGFTLLEMVIAISILAIMLAAVVFSYDGSKSRGQILVTAMDEYGGALQRLKADTACYPTKVSGLLDKTALAGTGGSFCGSDISTQWNGPYVKPVPYIDTGHILLKNIAPEIQVNIGRKLATVGTDTYCNYYIVAEKVPSDVAEQAVIACNGDVATGNTAATAATANKQRCQYGANASSGDLSDVSYLFDQTKASGTSCATPTGNTGFIAI